MDKQKKIIWATTLICVVICLMGISFFVGFGWGLTHTDDMAILACAHHFNNLMKNATESCVQQITEGANWTAMMEECQKCECEEP